MMFHVEEHDMNGDDKAMLSSLAEELSNVEEANSSQKVEEL
jgi:hypothetical protein